MRLGFAGDTFFFVASHCGGVQNALVASRADRVSGNVNLRLLASVGLGVWLIRVNAERRDLAARGGPTGRCVAWPRSG
jgi:hypothetical protein